MECKITTTLTTSLKYIVTKTFLIDGEPKEFIACETEYKSMAVVAAMGLENENNPHMTVSIQEVETRVIETKKEVWHNRLEGICDL